MEDATRTLFHDALAKSANATTRALADVVVAETQGRLACWGDLVEYVRAHFQSDDDSLALWRVLTDVGDRRPQLLFLDVHRARPGVLRGVLGDVARIPVAVQCALVSMPEAEPLLAALPSELSPAAREIATATPTVRVRERAIYDAHVGSLRSRRAGATLGADAIVRHLTDGATLLRTLADVRVPSPIVATNQPVEVAQPARPDVATNAVPVIPAPQVVHPIIEAPQALRPGGLP